MPPSGYDIGAPGGGERPGGAVAGSSRVDLTKPVFKNALKFII